jgi:hypothetical protein
MRDTYNNQKFVTAIAPFTVSDNTPLVGAIIGHVGFNSLTYAIQTGNIADSDAFFNVLLEHGNEANMSDAVAVPDVDLLGTEIAAGFTFLNDGETRKLGYIGSKAYSRLTLTPNVNTGNAPLSAMAVLGHASVRPV